ncbi:MAG TPA: DUF4386 family protein [Anaerolineae bacterium]|nr:DUF4386 family protein [Anaerolineae bacterium]
MQTLRKSTGALLLLEGLLLFLPLIILGGAIGWPETLGDPASSMLPLIFEQAGPTRLGYFIYLIYSLLFFPVVVLAARVAVGNDQDNLYVRFAVGFGAASALARCIGIIRWLIPMPALAVAYTAPGVTSETQATISIIFDMLNNFGGSIGEILGVSMFASFAILSIAILILKNNAMPAWTGYFALISFAMLLIPAVEIFGIDPGIFLTISVLVIQFWFMIVSAYLLTTAQSPAVVMN